MGRTWVEGEYTAEQSSRLRGTLRQWPLDESKRHLEGPERFLQPEYKSRAGVGMGGPVLWQLDRYAGPD